MASPDRGALPVLNRAHETEREIPQVCRMLRTKTAFGTLAGGDPWQFGESSTAVFWCLHTMMTVGPDDNYAHAQTCCAGRACFEADE